MKNCPKCNAECQDEETFCGQCGEILFEDELSMDVEKKPADVSIKNATGNDFLGTLSLIFSIVGGLGIIGLIFDIITINSASSSAKGKKYAQIGLVIAILWLIAYIAAFVVFLQVTGS